MKLRNVLPLDDVPDVCASVSSKTGCTIMINVCMIWNELPSKVPSFLVTGILDRREGIIYIGTHEKSFPIYLRYEIVRI